jgi:hypothetical protein
MTTDGKLLSEYSTPQKCRSFWTSRISEFRIQTILISGQGTNISNRYKFYFDEPEHSKQTLKL